MKKNLIIFASQNSFFTLPPVKQLLNYFKTVASISSIHSKSIGYEDFFSESKYQNVVNNYTDYTSYNRQTKLNKISKYFRVTILLLYQIFRNIFRYDKVYIYSCELVVSYLLFTWLLFSNQKRSK